MKQKHVEFKHTASSKDYLLALVDFPDFIKLLNPENKSYEKLYQWILENENFLRAEDRRLPSIKEIAKKINTDSGKTAGYLKMIYDDILLLNTKEPEKFKKDGQVLCDLSFKYIYDDYAYFSIGLDVIPRVGEGFDFSFVKPIAGSSVYYVKNVSHYYTNYGHSISIRFFYDYPNQYLQLIREKAYLKHYISFQDFYSEHNFALEEKLLKLFTNL